MREIHWHPNNDEFQYYLTGKGRMTVFADNGTSRTFNYRAGDVGYVPAGMGIMSKIPEVIPCGFWKHLKVNGSRKYL